MPGLAHRHCLATPSGLREEAGKATSTVIPLEYVFFFFKVKLKPPNIQL